jgi:hypothetical protein
LGTSIPTAAPAAMPRPMVQRNDLTSMRLPPLDNSVSGGRSNMIENGRQLWESL